MRQSRSDFLCLVVACQPSVATSSDSLAEDVAHRYTPILDALGRWPQARLCWHISGNLLDHLARHHEGFLLRLKEFVDAGQIEILGGLFYGGAPGLLSEADVRGQIAMSGEFWESFVGQTPQGIFLPEMAWAAELPRLLEDTGIHYALVTNEQVRAAQGSKGSFGRLERGGLPLFALCVDGACSVALQHAQVENYVSLLQQAAASAREAGAPLSVVLRGQDLGPRGHGDKKTGLDVLMQALQETGFSQQLPSTLLQHNPTARPMVLTREYAPLLPADKRPDVVSWAEFPARYFAAETLYRRMLRASERLRQCIAMMEDEGLEERWSDGLATAQRAIFRAQSVECFGSGQLRGFADAAVRDATLAAVLEAEGCLDTLQQGQDSDLEVEETDLDGDLAADIFVGNPSANIWIRPEDGGSIRSFELRGLGLNVLDAHGDAALPQGICDSLAHGSGSDTQAMVVAEAGDAADLRMPWRTVHNGIDAQPQRRYRLDLACDRTLPDGCALQLKKTVLFACDKAELSLELAVAAPGRCDAQWALRVPLRLGCGDWHLEIDGRRAQGTSGRCDGVQGVTLVSGKARVHLAIQDHIGTAEPLRLDWSSAQAVGGKTDAGTNTDTHTDGIVLCLSRPVGTGFATTVVLSSP